MTMLVRPACPSPPPAVPPRPPVRKTAAPSVVYWPAVTAAAALAGFVVVGLIGASWLLSRPAGTTPAAPSRVGLPAGPVVADPLPAGEGAAVAWPLRGDELVESRPARPVAPPPIEPGKARPIAPDLDGEPPATYKKELASPPLPPVVEERPAAAPPEVQVQRDEPAADCGMHGTRIAFARSPAAAAQRAREEDKLLMVMHISGHFEDPQFT